MTLLLRYWKPLAALVLLGLAYGWGYTTARTAGLYALQVERTRAEQVIAESAKAEFEASERARKAEQALLTRIAEIDAANEKALAESQGRFERDIAAYRAGQLRLRAEWRQCETRRVSEGAIAASELDAGADERGRLAAEIVRVGARADAVIRGLQDYARAVSD